jgi:DNA-binding NtrC family response regulator
VPRAAERPRAQHQPLAPAAGCLKADVARLATANRVAAVPSASARRRHAPDFAPGEAEKILSLSARRHGPFLVPDVADDPGISLEFPTGGDVRERPTTQLSWLDEVADGPRPSVLLIEPDEAVARVLRRSLLAAGFQVELITDAEQDLADVLTRAASWDAVIIDLDLGTADALAIKRSLRQAGSLAPVTILSTDSTAASAVRCLQAGALHYLTKPVELDELVAKTRTSTGLTTMRRIAAGAPQGATPLLIGETPPIARLRLAIHRVGRQEVPVLLHGESGTGKELVARSLHDASPRASGPFVAINLAAVPEGVIDSELFGHRRGAFTGAVTEHPGMLVSAHGGTLLLDEIGDMPLTVQGRLLRFLQEGEVRPIGSNAALAVDVRVIAATHIDLPAAVAAGRFREDLYYRLNVASLTVPPLRERLGDVPLLAAHFLRKHGGERHRTLTPAALELLEAQPWPGNVRQLENTLRSAMTVALDDAIDDRDFRSRCGTWPEPGARIGHHAPAR